jgi:hypothetical protein
MDSLLQIHNNPNAFPLFLFFLTCLIPLPCILLYRYLRDRRPRTKADLMEMAREALKKRPMEK